jgi:hypothetical protein
MDSRPTELLPPSLVGEAGAPLRDVRMERSALFDEILRCQRLLLGGLCLPLLVEVFEDPRSSITLTGLGTPWLGEEDRLEGTLFGFSFLSFAL